MIRRAYFAGGCFWCVTPIYKFQKGVISVRCGYSGGREENPTYEEVKSQKTGHRETIRVTYDDAQIAFDRLFEIFLFNVDPFDGGGQYIDRGRSYTLAVYYTCEEERQTAARRLDALEKERGEKTFVALEPFSVFYEAEENHQDYFEKNPEAFEEELRASGRKKDG